MKTHILQLESHDDAISTRDKMGWDQAGRIILVWPERERILTRKLDLVLLQRRCYDLGAQMALVTKDPEVRDNARKLHIAVFNSTLEAQNNRWRGYRRRPLRTLRPVQPPDLNELRQEAHPEAPGWMLKPIARLGFFTLGVIAFLSIVAVLLPGADISLKPKTQFQETSLSVAASTGVNAVRLSGDVPAYTTTVAVEGRQTISTTASTQVPEKSATGYVRFTNLTEQEVKVPKGTIVQTRPISDTFISFITTSDGDVFTGTGQSASVPIRAMNPGLAGNLPSDSLSMLVGPLGLSLAVNNPVGTFGGTNRIVAAPGSKDYTQLISKLTGALARTALEELKRTLPPDSLMITSTLVLVSGQYNFDPPPPAQILDNPLPADELSVSAHQVFQVTVVAGKDINELAKGILDANLPKNLSVKSDTLELQPISVPTVSSNGSIHWRIHAKRTVQANLNQSQAINIVLGRTPTEAMRMLLAQMPLEESPTIKLLPAWWPVMPVMSFRISVNIR